MNQLKTRKKTLLRLITIFGFVLSPFFLLSQVSSRDSLLSEVTLKNAIDYAIIHQPVIRQSLLDQEIVESSIKGKLSEMYPQINFNYNLQHTFVVQSAQIGGNIVKLGAENLSAAQFTFTQAIFNKEVLLANKTKADIRLQASQSTSSNKIELAAAVSKAFYEVLSTMQQIKISGENIARIERSLKDAYNQYTAGIADKIDYKRATINLNNSKATKRSDEAMLQSKLEYLKSLMGYPVSGKLNIVFDSTQLEREIMLDTLQVPDYNARIEYRLLETQKKLLQYNVQYNKWGYLPTVSANGAYNFSYQNNQFGKLYSYNFPYSFAAINVGFPIFQGGKRKANSQLAALDLQRNELEMVGLKNKVNGEYAQSMAIYKSSLYFYLGLKENLLLAQEVYDVVQLQYRSGIKTYLEVITSETDLRASQIVYYTAMYRLMEAKIDVQKALGQINY